jgi:hypothetical protein
MMPEIEMFTFLHKVKDTFSSFFSKISRIFLAVFEIRQFTIRQHDISPI